VRQRGEFRRRTGAQDCPSAGCGESLAIDGVWTAQQTCRSV